MFTSSRDGEMDEYNHSPAEHLYACDAGRRQPRAHQLQPERRLRSGAAPRRPHRLHALGALRHHEPLPAVLHQPRRLGHVPHVRPARRATSSTPTPTPDGRLIAIESTMIEEDAGPIAVLKLEQGPADPVIGSSSTHWDVVTAQVNNDGEPWPYGAFKYPQSDRRQPLRRLVHAAGRHRGRRRLRPLHLHAEPAGRRHAGRSRHVHGRQPHLPLQRPATRTSTTPSSSRRAPSRR